MLHYTYSVPASPDSLGRAIAFAGRASARMLTYADIHLLAYADVWRRAAAARMRARLRVQAERVRVGSSCCRLTPQVLRRYEGVIKALGRLY